MQVAKLSADLHANTTKFESGFKRASGVLGRFSSKLDRSISKSGRGFDNINSRVNLLSKSMGRLSFEVGQFAGIAASAFSVSKIVQYSDTYKSLVGRLSLVTDGVGDLVDKQEQLFQIAQKTRQPLKGIVDFYSRLNQFIPESERSQYDLLKVTESVSSALAITGETGASSEAALVQFTQAIGTNFEAAGQEIRSLQEQAPRLTQALVSSLGGGVKSLKQLQEEGALSRESVLKALSDIGGEAAKLSMELENIPVTVGQAFTKLDNAFLKLIGQSNLINSGTSSLAAGITVLANNLEVAAKAVVGLSLVLGVKLAQSLVGVASSAAKATIAQAALTKTTTTTMTAMAGMGSTVAANIVAVNSMSLSARVAAISMGILSASATVARSAFALLGGWFGIFATGAASVIIFKDQIIDTIKKFPRFYDVLKDLGDIAKTTFIGVSAIITGTFSGALNSLKKVFAEIEILYFQLTDKIAQTTLGGKLGIEPYLPSLSSVRLSGQSISSAFAEGFQKSESKIQKSLENMFYDDLTKGAEDVSESIDDTSQSLGEMSDSSDKSKRKLKELADEYRDTQRKAQDFGTRS
jgi:tape measure domain-containing protein